MSKLLGTLSKMSKGHNFATNLRNRESKVDNVEKIMSKMTKFDLIKLKVKSEIVEMPLPGILIRMQTMSKLQKNNYENAQTGKLCRKLKLENIHNVKKIFLNVDNNVKKNQDYLLSQMSKVTKLAKIVLKIKTNVRNDNKTIKNNSI